MRALEDCVSGLFSYSDKSSSHIPRSLTRLHTDTSQLSSLIVCPVHKVTNYTELLQTLKSMCFNGWLRSCRSFVSMHPHVGLITPKTSKFLHKELQSSGWVCWFLLLSDAVFFSLHAPENTIPPGILIFPCMVLVLEIHNARTRHKSKPESTCVLDSSCSLKSHRTAEFLHQESTAMHYM